MDVISSHGVIVANPESGEVEKVVSRCNCGECGLDDILKFDVEEYRKHHNAELPDTVDILDIGYWEKNGEYEEPCHDWREEMKLAQE